MGVCGSGKSTIGQLLSAVTGYPFYDADDFHPKENIAKMNTGLPLTDDDRWPWLEKIHEMVTKEICTGNLIIACSALKKEYRYYLSKSIEPNCRWVFLQGDFNTIHERLKSRTGHFMSPDLLRSQFDALEIPEDAIQTDISLTPTGIVDDIISKLYI